MPTFSAYEGLPFAEQFLHGAHFMVCCFAVLIACIPLLTVKGTPEHKLAGKVYLPVSMLALLLASYMAWMEQSAVLFCFNCFCAYLLMSGWRAVHEDKAPTFIDWFIPGSLFAIAAVISVHAIANDSGKRTFYLLFFALNAFYIAGRDWQHTKRRAYWSKHQAFFGDARFGAPNPTAWLGRHVAGMVGSMMANLSVVVLTLLPLELHWIWPVSLLFIGAYIAQKEQRKKKRVREALAPILSPKFNRNRPKRDEDIRRAA
ncbi:MAG TPA: hypothetical protein VFR09_08510 [Alphaproteobacteria bacterium]|nr:hypothetical protein [Alphaproteobacteria bacterium]